MPTCGKCSRNLDDGGQIRKCCEGTFYCNRKCERANFQTHRLSCPKVDHKPSMPMRGHYKKEDANRNKIEPNKTEHEKEDNIDLPAIEPLMKQVNKPFLRLKRGDYLQGRPQTDVYRLLNDVYLLRVADNGIQDGLSPNAEDFHAFLDKAKAVPSMLPSWWSDKKQAECEELGKVKGWGRLAYTILNLNNQGQNGERFMDIQLRLLAEYIYGTGIGDKRRCPLRQEFTKIPSTFKTHEIGMLLQEVMTRLHYKENVEFILATLRAVLLLGALRFNVSNVSNE